MVQAHSNTAGDDGNNPREARRAGGLAEFQGFYGTRLGITARRLVTRRVERILADRLAAQQTSGIAAGLGYSRPYLQLLDRAFSKVIGLQTASGEALKWPRGAPARMAVADEGGLPLLPTSLDLVLMVHGLELAHDQAALLDECWRVLNSHGRLVLVVPHRGSIWSGSERTPFGHGQPYSVNQIRDMLGTRDFEVVAIHHALTLPPSHSFLYPRLAPLFERLPKLFGGVLIVDARKMVYSVRGAPAAAKGRILRPALAGINAGLVPGAGTGA